MEIVGIDSKGLGSGYEKLEEVYISNAFLPLKGGAPSLIIIFALGLSLAVTAGFFGLAVGLILTSWFWKYTFVLFDHITRGDFVPPALDIQMVNPVDEQRPLALLFILGVMYVICHLLSAEFGPRLSLVVAAGLVTCLPAIIAVLAFERNILVAMNPVEWFGLIRGLRWWYPGILLTTAIYIAMALLVWNLHLWLTVQLAIGLFLSLSWFSVWAGLLYARRDDIGLQVWHSPEIALAREQSLEVNRSTAVLDEAYGLARVNRHPDAWSMISDWLKSCNHRSEAFQWAADRMASWDDSRYWVRINQEQLDHLLSINATSQALATLELALRRDSSFRPKSAGSTLRLAQIAATGGAPGIARIVLSDFGNRFPDDPCTEPARMLGKRLDT